MILLKQLTDFVSELVEYLTIGFTKHRVAPFTMALPC
jgi:hypothetical protein